MKNNYISNNNDNIEEEKSEKKNPNIFGLQTSFSLIKCASRFLNPLNLSAQY